MRSSVIPILLVSFCRIPIGSESGSVRVFPGMQEEFLITLCSCYAAGMHTFHCTIGFFINDQPGGQRRITHSLYRAFVQSGVSNNSATADISAIKLELRFNQNQKFCGRPGSTHHGWYDLCHGNERDIYGNQVRRFRDLFGAQISRIFLDLSYTGVLVQTPCHLRRSYVHGINFPRAMLQQAIRKASRGRPDVEARLSGWIYVEIFDCAFEFKSSATCVFCRCSADFDLCICGNLHTGFVTPSSVYANFSGQDHGLSFFARFREPFFDDQYVEALFLGFWFGGQCNSLT